MVFDILLACLTTRKKSARIVLLLAQIKKSLIFSTQHWPLNVVKMCQLEDNITCFLKDTDSVKKYFRY